MHVVLSGVNIYRGNAYIEQNALLCQAINSGEDDATASARVS